MKTNDAAAGSRDEKTRQSLSFRDGRWEMKKADAQPQASACGQPLPG
ncbi:hypothetical protein HA052_26910 [Chromobacterium haemolyticum]|uniref:Uncharacterized protein n=1 Tax=Chromobacterium fluminis TaxID=3044269 RepID=A0ABX0LIW1_9NEIS|nr:hypothetical protein [Chromobacterium haemolyticum]NHR08823.1 hypothetical protein [Chromobacterium haemolyticum]